MSAQTLRFEFPLPPRLNTNAFRGHWGRAAREKKQWYSNCDARQALGLLPRPPAAPFRHAAIQATLYVARLHDADNAFHRCAKFPLDYLKTRGFIVDDSPTHIHWTGIPTQRVTKNGNAHYMEIVLTELSQLPEPRD